MKTSDKNYSPNQQRLKADSKPIVIKANDIGTKRVRIDSKTEMIVPIDKDEQEAINEWYGKHNKIHSRYKM